MGYTWGWLSSIAFGRHYQPLLACDKPKLFLMGERDEVKARARVTVTARARARVEVRVRIRIRLGVSQSCSSWEGSTRRGK